MTTQIAPHRAHHARLGCLLALWLALCGASPVALAAPGEVVTTALPVVTPGEFNGDLRQLPQAPGLLAAPRAKAYRPRPAGPGAAPSKLAAQQDTPPAAPSAPAAAMPSPVVNVEGIARLDSCTGGQCGNGTPPDTNGEVGPNHYIQAVNQAYGIYDKTGALLASFTEDALWTGDSSICNGSSFGDPIVVYDALADRWILSHFAFALSGNNTVQPYYQCIAASKTSDPVTGGWWLYPVRVDDASHPWLDDYPKFGAWTDCLYMSANEFTGAGAFAGTLFASFSRADLYSGAPLTASIGYITNTSDPFSMVPSHLGGQAGANVPAGTPNYFVSESQTAFAFEVRKFTAGPNCGAGGTLGAPVNVSQTSYVIASGATAPQPGTNIHLDVIDDRVMQKVQYRKVGATESLWVAHTYATARSGNANTGIQWAQINVTGGTVATTPLQQQKYSPDSTLFRFMPSLAVDGQGNMALGYSTSNANTPNYPSIAYSGRLAGDAANTLPQTETQLVAGGGSQTGNCGGSACNRWGDYSSMSVDPVDDCTFWITNEYYPGPFDPNTIAWHTRIGSFKYPGCASGSRTADLAITKSDGAASTQAGAPIAYTIVVTNNGPFAVSGATVSDTVPAAITGASWTCTASPGSSCPASGSGNISTSAVNLLKGGTATFVLSGTVSPAATGTLSNTATVAVPAGFIDPVPGNNSATDTDTIIVPGVLPPTIAKAFAPTAIVVGQASQLTITVTNPNGSNALTGVAFTDTLPAGIGAPNASAPACGGTAAVVSNVVTLTGGSLAAGANCQVIVPVTGVQAQATPWTNTIAAVSSNEGGTNSTPAMATITVGQAATVTAIVSDLPDPSVSGQGYVVSYAVSVAAPGAGTPTGTVTVSDGSASCTGTLPATSCTLTSTTAGTKSLVATYNGSANFAGSTSAAASHQVNKAGTTTTIVSDTPDPSLVGQPYTVTYAVAVSAPGAGTPGGTVTVSDGVAQCTGTLPATSCQLASTSSGAKSLTATYGGNANFNGSASATAPHQVNAGATTTAIVSDLPDPTVVGQPYTVTYAVSPTAPSSGTPTGTVTVSDGASQCVGTLPAASCQLTSTTAGAKSLVATYAGDANFTGSASTPAPHQVNPAATTTSIVSDTPDPSLVGQPYTVSYSVTVSAPGSGTPAGTVTISDGTSQCTGTLPATSCQLASVAAGAKSLTATYGGSANFAGSVSAPAPHQVDPGATTTAIVSDLPDPTVTGQPYTVTYAVSATAPASGSPTGTVTVSDGTSQCTGTLPSTSCQLASTTAGAKQLVATYGGDANFTGSASAPAAHQVNPAATVTAVVSDLPDPSVVGQPYTVTYSVSVTPPGAGTPTGSVTVSDGAAQCVGTLPATSCQLASASPGGKSLTATYAGDANFAGSASGVTAHAVNKADTTTTIVSDLPDPTGVAQPYTVTFAVGVNAPGAGTPTGTVTVSDGAASCMATLPATSCQLASTTVGPNTLSATYGGDAAFNGSVSAGAPHTVSSGTSTTAIVSATPNPSVVGQPYTVVYNVSVSSGVPTGTVTVSDGTDQCVGTLPATSCQLTSTTSGLKLLLATYSGDLAHTGSVSPTLGHTVVTVAQQGTVTVSLAGSGSGNVSSTDGYIACGASCSHLYPFGTAVTLNANPDSGSTFTGWLGGCVGTGPCSLGVGGDIAVQATFAPSTYGPKILDIDDNGAYDALTDGLMTIRFLFGLTGNSVISGAIGTGALRSTQPAIDTYLGDVRPQLDVDGNGQADALTDGLMILRYLFGLRGASLIQGAVGPGATRTTATAIETYIGSLMP